MKTFAIKTSQFCKFALIACAIGTVAGCGSSLTDDPIRNDARLQHPIQVAREQVSVTITLPEQGTALAPEDQRRLSGFIRDFANRGRTTIMIESQMGERAREILQSQGLRATELVVTADTTIKAPSAVLTFTANVAQAPNCGDWSENSAFNPTNNLQPDFGCSNRRNLSLTVADPGDLIDPQPMSGSGAARRDSALDAYNAGTPLKQPASTTQAVSGVK